MIRLFTIEWLKLKNYKLFWILFGMYFLGLLIVCSSGMFLLEYIESKGGHFFQVKPTLLPIYDFPDVWHNMTYIATFFKLFLAFIVVISVVNEMTYRTLRQNIIDGLSKKEFLLSKLSLIVSLSAAAALFLFLVSFVLGLIYSHSSSNGFIFRELEFMPAYFLELIAYLSFAFLLAVLMRKSGFVIVLLFMYTLIFEPTLTAIMEYNSFIPDSLDVIIPFMPIKSLNNLISVPFPKYVFMRIQDFVAWKDVAIVVAWLMVYNLLILWVLKRRNV